MLAVVVSVVALGVAVFKSSEVVVERFGAFPGPEILERVDFLGGTLFNKNVATSTTGTATTLRFSDVQNVDTLFVTPNTSDLTLTFFSSTSAKAWLPKAGDRQMTCVFNATTTAGIDVLFVSGTGIDFEQSATSTATNTEIIKIGPHSGGCFNFVRGPVLSTAFDIWALYTPFWNAD